MCKCLIRRLPDRKHHILGRIFSLSESSPWYRQGSKPISPPYPIYLLRLVLP